MYDFFNPAILAEAELAIASDKPEVNFNAFKDTLLNNTAEVFSNVKWSDFKFFFSAKRRQGLNAAEYLLGLLLLANLMAIIDKVFAKMTDFSIKHVRIRILYSPQNLMDHCFSWLPSELPDFFNYRGCYVMRLKNWVSQNISDWLMSSVCLLRGCAKSFGLV